MRSSISDVLGDEARRELDVVKTDRLRNAPVLGLGLAQRIGIDVELLRNPKIILIVADHLDQTLIMGRSNQSLMELAIELCSSIDLGRRCRLHLEA